METYRGEDKSGAQAVIWILSAKGMQFSTRRPYLDKTPVFTLYPIMVFRNESVLHHTISLRPVNCAIKPRFTWQNQSDVS